MYVSNQIFNSPVSQALQVIGDRWTIYILRDAFLGRHRFNEFIKYSVKSRVTLTKRLNWLIENDILYKYQYMEKPPRHEYRLTNKGLGLYPWALTIWQWESTWANPNDAHVPTSLTHNHKKPHQLIPLLVCRSCKQRVLYKDIKVRKLKSLSQDIDAATLLNSVGNQRRTKVEKENAQDKSLGHIVDIIGDRWSNLIIAASFLGVKRFDDFEKELKIATNILADRLKKLTELEVVVRQKYQDTPARFEYKLSEKGVSLYSQTLALRQWVLDHFEPTETDFELIHTQCGSKLDIDIVCGDCKEIPSPGDVSFHSRD